MPARTSGLASPFGLCNPAREMTDTYRIPALLLLLATLAFGVAPFVTPPFTGYDPALFPVRIERPSIQPAGYAFSIWSVIYLWLFAHGIFGLWKRPGDPAWGMVRLPLGLAMLIGAVWLSIAGQSAIWGTITIWAMAISAITAFLRADPVQDPWLLSAPTAIFAGWLTAASGVSTGVLIAGYGWLSDTQSAAAMLVLVLAIAITIQRFRPASPIYGVTVIWALAGVIVANQSPNPTVAALAAGGIVIVAIAYMAKRRSGTMV